MARRRISVAPKAVAAEVEVPVELLDHQSPAWLSSAAFRLWCREHLGHELTFNPLADQGPFHGFCAAVEQWTVLNGLGVKPGHTDWAGLAELGIRRPRRLRGVV